MSTKYCIASCCFLAADPHSGNRVCVGSIVTGLAVVI
jgi:hypothetical protein